MHSLLQGGFKIRALHIDFGQAAAREEWRAVRAVARKLEVPARTIRIRSAKRFKPGEIHGRNGAFIFLAFMNLERDENLICIGIHAGTQFADCSPSFFAGISRVIAEETDSQIRVIAPLLDMSKASIVTLARKEGWSIDSTYSCQRGRRKPCGRCLSCKDRAALQC
jgi:7-cyano-7-deazaguanine synthase